MARRGSLVQQRQGKHQYTGGKHQGHNVNMVAFSYNCRRCWLASIQKILGGCVAECLLARICQAYRNPHRNPSPESGIEARTNRALPDTNTTSQGRGVRTIREQAIVQILQPHFTDLDPFLPSERDSLSKVWTILLSKGRCRRPQGGNQCIHNQSVGRHLGLEVVPVLSGKQWL